MGQYGLWVDVSGMTFDDAEGTWIQALPLGTYEHPEYGTIEITPEKVAQFAQNVSDKVRGQDLDIDYDHKQRDGVAAGWVTAADARTDGLYLNVKWTDKARQHLTAKEYRYFSPEFTDEWTHPATKATHKNVLFGGALTNRPFLKGILPINLSEMMMADGTPPGGGGSDNGGPSGSSGSSGSSGGDGAPNSQTADKVVSELANLLKLPSNASPDLVLGAMMMKLGATGGSPPKPPNPNDGGGDGGAPAGGPPKPPAPPHPAAAPQMSEGGAGDVTGIQLSEEDKKNPTTVALAEAVNRMEALAKAQADVIKGLSSDNASYKAAEVLDQITEGNVVLAPATKEAATKLMLSEKPEERAQGLKDLLAGIVKGAATVELGERGQAGNHSGGSSAIKVFNEAIAEKQKANTNMTFSDAMHRVGVENPQLQLDYLEAVRNGETV
jgi:hypothetical protein